MTAEERLRRFREFESYVGWTDEDAGRVRLAATPAEPFLPALVDDFYETIDRYEPAREVITGGPAQVERLKRSLLIWIRDLLSGVSDQDYVDRRWQVGWRHADIGLEAAYVNLALSRLREGLCRIAFETDAIPDGEKPAVVRSLNARLDLDLALIEDAYQTEHRSRLQASERLATIGQVTGGVAHELRNPLNVVKTSVYYLLNARNPTPQKSAEHLQRIERQVNLADSVIMALSNFARTPIPTFRPFPVEPLLREVLADNPPGAAIRLEIRIAEGLPPALADREQLRIVVANLVRNACDAMPRGGTLGITAETESDGARVAIAVRDEGVGISRENLARIMEPLFSTKARGLGLGLSIARAILDKNNGRMSVESELGRGSMFTIRIPSGNGESETQE